LICGGVFYSWRGFLQLERFSTVGVVGRISKDDIKGIVVKPSKRQVITPEVYSGEQSWEN